MSSFLGRSSVQMLTIRKQLIQHHRDLKFLRTDRLQRWPSFPVLSSVVMKERLQGERGHTTCTTISKRTHSTANQTTSQTDSSSSSSTSTTSDNTKFDEDKEKEERRRRQVKWTNYSFVGLCAGFVSFAGWALYNWGQPEIGEDGHVIEDEYMKYPTIQQYVYRTWGTLRNYKQSFEDPSRELLLPDPVKPPYIQPKYTIVFETNGVFLHPEWTYQTGWRFKKRPFIDQFLQQCGPPLFETVSFTQDSPLTAAALIDALDTQGKIMFRLFRDSTRYVDGKRIKDLNYLNRDLSKVIHIDWDRNACSLNPHNCIILDKWLGDGNDSTLIDLATFLRTIASQDVEDVREIIAHYSQFDKPLEVFKENQRRIVEMEEQRHKQPERSFVSSFKRKF